MSLRVKGTPRGPALCLAIALLSSTIGCTQRWRVPLTGPMESAAVDCVSMCEAEANTPGAYRACLASCPGAQVESGECGPEDTRPAAVCVEHQDVARVALPVAVVTAIVALVVLGVAAGS